MRGELLGESGAHDAEVIAKEGGTLFEESLDREKNTPSVSRSGANIR